MRLQKENPHVFFLFIANSLYCFFMLGRTTNLVSSVAGAVLLVPSRLDVRCSAGTTSGYSERRVMKSM